MLVVGWSGEGHGVEVVAKGAGVGKGNVAQRDIEVGVVEIEVHGEHVNLVLQIEHVGCGHSPGHLLMHKTNDQWAFASSRLCSARHLRFGALASHRPTTGTTLPILP